MIIALLVGIISGWLISMPIGPTNAAAIARTIQYNFKHGFIVGLGGAAMDIIYCGGATQINAFLLRSPIINLVFQIVGFGLLIFLGIKSFRAEQKPHPFEPTPKDTQHEKRAQAQVVKMHIKKASYFASFSLGVVLYASNVAGVPEWIFISAFWHNQGVQIIGFSDAIAFAIGAGIGTAGWFFTLVKYFSKRSTSLKPRTLHIINRFAGFAMLAFGLYFGYQIIFKTDWNNVQDRWKTDVKKTFGAAHQLESTPRSRSLESLSSAFFSAAFRPSSPCEIG
ncbi:MAG: LysE family transporter [Bacteroidota bacterium]|nr:LysE family transporter [Bacteroidota bacterium]MDP4229517.1 LysE family transporter [Bacteroidota bacterium]MDP4235862.1 LysE family transporter [Bacteroidota bacterium]